MNPINKVTKFISEVKIELTKVSWSTREEVLGATSVVIGVTFMLAVFIGVVDLFLSKILSTIFR